ncbi:hypothetical protein H5410_014796 [Solanum commersonii]|uniref:Uncharacterized protein n=1 Tax=Solanum commersonii TaxID=4109 RepID=A0A9J5ZSH6_SOLCO|nr:hypothetical protein H5410_014796 [Solanum commersonii]
MVEVLTFVGEGGQEEGLKKGLGQVVSGSNPGWEKSMQGHCGSGDALLNATQRHSSVTPHCQRFSNSPYLLQMQVRAQPRYSSALTKRIIPYSHTMV